MLWNCVTMQGGGDSGKTREIPRVLLLPITQTPTISQTEITQEISVFTLRGILKTVVANYALDKLKIEITRNSHPRCSYLSLWEGLAPSIEYFRHCGRFVSG
jgi:hypothetical protein